jgi:DNA-directed RNA polymerase subunit RPC12/RpoP
MLPTHDVDCPCCGQFVFTSLSLDDDFPAEAPTVPKVRSDRQGDYLLCPHCGYRMAMNRITTDRGVVFRAAGR